MGRTRESKVSSYHCIWLHLEGSLAFEQLVQLLGNSEASCEVVMLPLLLIYSLETADAFTSAHILQWAHGDFCPTSQHAVSDHVPLSPEPGLGLKRVVNTSTLSSVLLLFFWLLQTISRYHTSTALQTESGRYRR